MESIYCGFFRFLFRQSSPGVKRHFLDPTRQAHLSLSYPFATLHGGLSFEGMYTETQALVEQCEDRRGLRVGGLRGIWGCVRAQSWYRPNTLCCSVV